MTNKDDQIKYTIKIVKNALKFIEKLDVFKYKHLIEEILKNKINIKTSFNFSCF